MFVYKDDNMLKICIVHVYLGNCVPASFACASQIYGNETIRKHFMLVIGNDFYLTFLLLLKFMELVVPFKSCTED